MPKSKLSVKCKDGKRQSSSHWHSAPQRPLSMGGRLPPREESRHLNISESRISTHSSFLRDPSPFPPSRTAQCFLSDPLECQSTKSYANYPAIIHLQCPQRRKSKDSPPSQKQPSRTMAQEEDSGQKTTKAAFKKKKRQSHWERASQRK